MSPAQPEEAPEDRVGTTLKDKWTLEALLGSGAMASVYAARHRIGRSDAIKILHRHYATDEVLRSRFEREARAVNHFQHPRAVEIRDIDVSDDGCPFLVMELLEGESLGERARRLDGIPIHELLRHVDELLDVLTAAHAHDIVHRDIKLDNLFVQRDGGLKVLDFGIARMVDVRQRLTQVGATLGTISYMPPEQVLGGDIDGRADLFAVGATMFRLIARRRIHEVDNPNELLVAMGSTPAPPLGKVAPSTPAGICLVVDRALAFDRAQRYPDAETMQRDVQALRDGVEPAYAARVLRESGPPNADEACAAPLRSEVVRRNAATVVDSNRSEDGAVAGISAELDSDDELDERLSGPSMEEQRHERANQLVGSTLGGQYRLESLIGLGGMGAVYESRDLEGKAVALKVILDDLGQDPAIRRRFAREARATAKLSSPHIVKVFDVGHDAKAEIPFIVMELLSGRDLDQLVRSVGAMEPATIAAIFVQACRGLEVAHREGLIHRDIKPANIYLADDANGNVTVKICDFGLAKWGGRGLGESASSLTATGGVLGTPMYCSPEQAMNAKHVDVRTDLWSIGVSMHEAVCGERPWLHCTTHGQLIVAIVTGDSPEPTERAPWLDEPLAAVVRRAMQRDLDERWPTATALLEALEPLAAQGELKREALVSIADESRALRPERVSATEMSPTSNSFALDSTVAVRPRARKLIGVAVGAAAIGIVIALIALRVPTDSNPPAGQDPLTTNAPVLDGANATSSPSTGATNARAATAPLASISATPTTGERPAAAVGSAGTAPAPLTARSHAPAAATPTATVPTANPTAAAPVPPSTSPSAELRPADDPWQ